MIQPPALVAKPLACVFSTVLEGKYAVCEYAASRNGPPGRRTRCTQALARAGCGELAALLLECSRFALAVKSSGHPAATARLQAHAGGLVAMRQNLDPASSSPNVHHLVASAQVRYGSLAQLPFSEMVRVIQTWREA